MSLYESLTKENLVFESFESLSQCAGTHVYASSAHFQSQLTHPDLYLENDPICCEKSD